MTDDVSVSLVSINVWWLAGDTLNITVLQRDVKGLEIIQGDQKVCLHLLITVKKTSKNIFNSFSQLPWQRNLNLGITEGVSVSSVPLTLAVGYQAGRLNQALRRERRVL
jgi:hypothetical protein